MWNQWLYHSSIIFQVADICRIVKNWWGVPVWEREQTPDVDPHTFTQTIRGDCCDGCRNGHGVAQRIMVGQSPLLNSADAIASKFRKR